MSSDQPSPAFRVVHSGVVRERLLSWAAQAERRGQSQWLATSLTAIEERLASDPVTWGDPLYTFPRLGLVVYHRAVEPIIVEYAVHDRKRVVFIKEFRLMDNHPLGPDE